MLPAYNLIVNITSKDKTISGTKFQEQVSPCLGYLDALKGSFSRVPCSTTYYAPFQQGYNSEFWSVSAVVMISLGKNRAEYLINLYKSIVKLIEHELPDSYFEVQAKINQMNFS